ncbi:MAG: hypothetical protein QXP35_02105 [Candidatus Micrarchaeaceae archaeon]
MDKEIFDKFSKFINENKAKRKFVQTVELAINFKGLDFSNQANRLNMEIVLPKSKGKITNVVVFADKRDITEKAKQLGAKEIISSNAIPSIANDKIKRNELLLNDLLAESGLMPVIAKNLGQFLGPRNKMPKPLIGNIENVFKNLSSSITLKSKGKYLPTIHCVVGTENMDVKDIADNIDAILNSVSKKLGKQTIKSVYTKLTMSNALKLI